MSTATQQPTNASGIYIRRLNQTNREIRLLEFRQQENDNAIHFNIHSVSLDHEPNFVALSYEWRLPGNLNLHVKPSIYVSGYEIQVAENLHFALRVFQLRPAYHRVHMWIDALCINQDDLEERAQQVPMMCDIYSRAEFVFAWLGPLHLTRPTQSLANQLIKEAETVRLSPNDPTLWLVQRLTDPDYRDHWEELRVLFAATFWRRSWIIQEIVLAQGSYLIYGIDFIFLDSALLLAQELRSFYVQVGHDDWPVPDLVLDMAPVISILEARLDLIASSSEPHLDLLQLLRKFSFSSVTDPRDTTYSLLGIAKRFPQTDLTINYLISVRDTMINTAVYIMKGTGSLDILRFAGSGQQDWPSWVPDWTAKGDMGVSRVILQNVSAASQGPDSRRQLYTSAIVSADRMHLTVDATIITEVDQVIRASNDNQIELKLEAVFGHLLRFTIADYLVSTQDSHLRETAIILIGSYSLYNAVFRTCSIPEHLERHWPYNAFFQFCVGITRERNVFKNMTGPQRKILWMGVFGANDRDFQFFRCRLPSAFDFFQDIVRWVTPQSNEAVRPELLDLLSTTGYVAIGTSRARIQRGDIIAKVTGCAAPLVLRPNHQSVAPGGFTLVGHALVDQLMGQTEIPGIPVRRLTLC